jgi:Raf kinase inhibitor-like YbhB/YbcL family protein
VKHFAALLILTIVATFTRPASADGVFTITSPAFQDGDLVAATYAFKGPGLDGTDCGGDDLSPPLQWSDPPAATQSFALVIFDVDGRLGAGVTHWVAYNMPATKLSVAQGEGTADATTLANGKNTRGTSEFRGFCPPKGDAPHHYVMTVYALDLPPSLALGMTRDDLLAAINHHVLGLASIVGRFGR